ncbi:MAG: YcjF family protein [Clostridia bacterium]|nr:YcjF family protein [Clostridia bacterium]
MEKKNVGADVSANEKKNSNEYALIPLDAQEERASGKLTIYEYEQKYTKRQNVRGAKILLRLLCGVVALLLFACLFFVSLRIYEINEYAGYAAGGVCLILYIVLFIVPMVKIMKSPYFIVNVNAKTAGAAKRHNRKVRREIADKIIDLTAKVDGVGWYDSATVGELAIAVKTNSDKGIMKALTALYTGSVKKSAKDLIFRSSMKSAMYSALSQTSKVDAALVVFLNLQLVKDIVFLYGFRPSDAKLVKIFGRVFQNSLIAYGLGGVKIGNSIVKTMGDAVKGIPFLGSAISAIVDSSVQGLTNGVLTAVIGYQTIKYLSQEYKLQQILDGVELVETEEELQETCQKIEKELKNGKKPQAA